MFSDMVGYTALMQRDEESARVARRRHRQALDAALAVHGGDLLNDIGDGCLTSFPSVLQAVRAAVEGTCLRRRLRVSDSPSRSYRLVR